MGGWKCLASGRKGRGVRQTNTPLAAGVNIGLRNDDDGGVGDGGGGGGGGSGGCEVEE